MSKARFTPGARVPSNTRGFSALQFGATSASLNPAWLPQFPYVGNGQPSGDITKFPAFALGGRVVGMSVKAAVVGVSNATAELFLNGVATGLVCILVAGQVRAQNWPAVPLVIPPLATNYIEVKVTHAGGLVALQYLNVCVYSEHTSPIPP